MGHGGWAVSSSCGGRELLRAGVPERCRPAGSERWRHLEEERKRGHGNAGHSQVCLLTSVETVDYDKFMSKATSFMAQANLNISKQ